MTGPKMSVRLRCGVRVYSADDPRHVGTIEAIHHHVIVQVRWDETRWISYLPIDDDLKREDGLPVIV